MADHHAHRPAAAGTFSLPGFGSNALRFNSIRVEFDDGFAMVTSGNAIRKAKP